MKFRQPLKFASTDSMALSIAPESFDDKTNEIDITWLDGFEIERRDPWGDRYILRFYPEGMNLARVNGGGACFFWNHPQMQFEGTGAIQPKHVIGTSLSASVSSEGKGAARVRLIPFNTDPIAVRPENQEGAYLVASGFVRGVSMGWQYDEVSIEEFPDTDQPPIVHVKRCTIVEFSAAPIQQVMGAHTASHQEDPMPKPNDTAPVVESKVEPQAGAPDAAALDAARLAGESAGKEAGAKAERDRIAGINQTCAALGLGLDVASAAIADGTPLQKFRDDAIAAKARAGDAASPRVTFQPGGDEKDKIREAMQEALYARATGKEPTDRARRFAVRHTTEMFREYLSMCGATDAARMSEADVLRYGLGFGAASGMIAPSDLPNLMQGTGNRILKDRLDQMGAPNYEALGLVRTITVPDYRASSVLDFGFVGSMEKVPVGKGPNPQTVTESAESFTPARYMMSHVWGKEAQRNDDLGALGRWAEEAAAGVLNTRLSSFWTEFQAGTVGGKAIFHTDHANITASSGGVPSVDQIGKGRKLMRKQTNFAGRPLDLYPEIIIFPAECETDVDKLLDPRLIQDSSGNAVPNFVRSLTPCCEPRLDATSTKLWYLASKRIPSFVEARLRGEEAPMFRRVLDERTLGVEMIVDWTFVHKATEYRTLYRNKGEA